MGIACPAPVGGECTVFIWLWFLAGSMAKKTSTSKNKGGKPKAAKKKPARAASPAKAKAAAKGKGSPKAKSGEKKPPPKAPVKGAVKGAAKTAVKAAAKPTAVGASKSGRKGITIVTPKPPRKPKAPKPVVSVAALAGQLLPPGTKRKPLIPSGPKAPVRAELEMAPGSEGRTVKSPLGKKDLARFRAILLKKRSDLVGDVSTMESEALMGHGGDLSHTPQHMAEQGTDTYEQTLSLDLAAADRRLIREIEDALKRIEDGTYGVCELTKQPIRLERLEELPWTRYSIEAARELERRSHRL